MLQPINKMIERLELDLTVADLKALRVIHYKSVDIVKLTRLVFLVLALTGKSAVSPMGCGGVRSPGSIVPI